MASAYELLRKNKSCRFNKAESGRVLSTLGERELLLSERFKIQFASVE